MTVRAAIPIALLLLGSCDKLSKHGPAPGATPSGALDPIDEKACQLLRRVSPLDLPRYLISHLAMPDGSVIDTVETGTMGYLDFQRTDAAGNASSLKRPEDTTETTRWDAGAYLLPFAGRIYALTFTGRRPVYLHSVARLTPDNRLQPLCLMEPRVDVSLLADGPGYYPVCDRVVAGQVRYVSERKIAASPWRPRGTGHDYSEAEMKVDFRNIGVSEVLERTSFTSSAGSGCDQSAYRPKPGHASAGAAELLAALNDRKPSRGGDLAYNCSDAPSRWFRYRGKTYLEMRSTAHRTPPSEEFEYWFVATVEKNRARRVCSGFYTYPAPRIITRWIGLGWYPKSPPTEE